MLVSVASDVAFRGDLLRLDGDISLCSQWMSGRVAFGHLCQLLVPMTTAAALEADAFEFWGDIKALCVVCSHLAMTTTNRQLSFRIVGDRFQWQTEEFSLQKESKGIGRRSKLMTTVGLRRVLRSFDDRLWKAFLSSNKAFSCNGVVWTEDFHCFVVV